MKKITLQQIADLLEQQQDILILTHQNPDGDTLGSGLALYYALRQKGKRVKMICSDPFPNKFGYLFDGFEDGEMEPQYIVSVDIADTQLFGKKLESYADKVDICIDHHPSNKLFGRYNYVDHKAAATCEIMYQLLQCMDVRMEKTLANCLYTGLSTDTGCFKFSNTTANTHRFAADLMEKGCDYAEINRDLFDTKTKSRIEVERAVLDSMEFFFENRVAMTVISRELIHSTGVDEAELDGISSIPRQIEGVQVGVTLRERVEGGYKVSLRTSEHVDASQICGILGGGGHKRAAGCTVAKPLVEAKETLVQAIRPHVQGS